MHTLEIKSDIASISEVEALIDKVCADHEVSEDLYGNILIAVTEATNNAIVHGNCKDLDKKVCLNVDRVEGDIVFTVVDEGNGFNYDSLPDPTAPENIEKPDGRGIFLMKNLSDKIEFLENGSKVNITFVLHG